MKILIVNTSDVLGGAAIAAFRLLHGINASNVATAKMLVMKKLSDDNNVIQMGSTLKNSLNFYSERANIFLKNRLSRNNLFDVSIANTGVSITNTKD